MESYHKKKIGSIPKDSTGGSSIRKGMVVFNGGTSETGLVGDCLLYTSDVADD